MRPYSALCTAILLCLIQESCRATSHDAAFYTKVATRRVRTAEELNPLWAPYFKVDIAIGPALLYYRLPVLRSYVTPFRKSQLLGYRNDTNETHYTFQVSFRTDAVYGMMLKLFDESYDYTDAVLKIDEVELVWNATFTVHRESEACTAYDFKLGPLPNDTAKLFVEGNNGLASESIFVLDEMKKDTLKKHFPTVSLKNTVLSVLGRSYKNETYEAEKVPPTNG